MVEEEEIMKFIADVEDPEMKISVIDLGLIYGLKIESSHVEIDMTLTSPGCPVAPELMAAVHRAALMADGIESAHVNLTFSPLWDPRVHASEDGKLDLGIF
ncbi:MAG: metal-sulfur cluster assembly factor [Candidatus Thalassarchaeaceae archaeon]|nr:metal-sulfur cluster assembly factor [Candidatus Thalassarchaeaceae archaeon]